MTSSATVPTAPKVVSEVCIYILFSATNHLSFRNLPFLVVTNIESSVQLLKLREVAMKPSICVHGVKH